MVRGILPMVLLVACGPSAHEIAAAHHAVYRAPAPEVLDIAIDVARAKHFEPVAIDRERQSFVAADRDVYPIPYALKMPRRWLSWWFEVDVYTVDDGAEVVITSHGSGQTSSLHEKPPYEVQKREDELWTAIYERAKGRVGIRSVHR